MKVWVDDIRTLPKGFDVAIHSVKEFKTLFADVIEQNDVIDELSLDHDAGEYKSHGGDYIEILNWFEYLYFNFGYDIKKYVKKFSFHTSNPVGRKNMKRIVNIHCWND